MIKLLLIFLVVHILVAPVLPAQTIDLFVDPTIGWETTKGRDFGVEMGLLNNKLKIEATYYDKNSNIVSISITQGTVSGASNWNNYVTSTYSSKIKGLNWQ